MLASLYVPTMTDAGRGSVIRSGNLDLVVASGWRKFYIERPVKIGDSHLRLCRLDRRGRLSPHLDVLGLFRAMTQARLSPCQMQSEPFAAVEPTPLQFESGDTKHLFNHFRRVLITVFGVNALTVGKSYCQSQTL